ncbi:MAG: hypothetical protein M5U08_08055 [Burkholderiales bacterium]|nr:hypothetical protein [Burkholderiales bacterium]
MRNMKLSKAVLVTLMATAASGALAKDEWSGDDDYWSGKSSTPAAQQASAKSGSGAACDSRYPLVDCFNP